MHPINAKYPAAGTIPAGTDTGHIRLKVSNIDKAMDMFSHPLDLEAFLSEAE